MLAFSQYRRIHLLGEGGCAQVFLVREIKSGREYALKEVKLENEGDSFVKEDLLWEFEALKSLPVHQNVISVVEQDPASGAYTMENFGTPLCKRASKLTLEQKIQVMAGVFQGLSHFHKNKKMHLDIKSGNVLLQDNGKDEIAVKLIDPIRFVEEDPFFGTLEYAAPEFMDGEPSASSDIFSAGVLFYELLMGKRPWDNSDSILESCMRVEEGFYPPIDEKLFPKEIIKLVQDLLMFSSSDRTKDASECLKLLKPFLKDSNV